MSTTKSEQSVDAVAPSKDGGNGRKAAGRASDEKWSGRGRSRKVSRNRRVPIVKFLFYYIAIVGVAVAVASTLPIARRAFVAPVTVPALDQVGDVLSGGRAGAVEGFASPLDRSVITVLVIAGALALALPIAWVARFTRQLRYDPSLVQSIVILPILVAGIVILVKNSLALAFSLAGIVAVVRFRNTLKDPKDAVYVFLVLSVGLAAGVQALDVALLVSLSFNLIVLAFWKYDTGGVFSTAGQSGVLSIGDASLLPLEGMRESRGVREQARTLAGSMETDGYLLVVAADAAAARRCVEISLTECASDWRVGDPQRAAGGLASFLVALDLRDKADPVDVLGELDERWPEQIAAAEYLPLRHVAHGKGD
ncbi:MAG: DUF4956 domain-containing protein [Longimicrobiales bacterium]